MILYAIFFLVLFNFYHICWGESYNVAVIEYAVNLNYSQPARDILEENGRNYLKIIENITQAQSEPLDLIIFPESTLTPSALLPDTTIQLPNSSNTILCNSTDDTYLAVLKDLSCAAVNHNTTIVINFTEKEICWADDVECPDSGTIFYNTNAALGSNGSVIGRYRKWNLFGEYGKNKPTTLDLPVIEIKNTRFGMMTCFDIQFGVPAFNLTKQKNIKNIIFPLFWISELPYLTALQTEQMWAQELDVVLLASGASFPRSGAGGSGIFYGNQGPLQSVMLPESGTKVLIQTVSTDIGLNYNISYKEDIDVLAASMDDFYMLIDPSMKEHNSVILNASEGSINSTVCHGEADNILCCDFKISISLREEKVSESYTYHLVAFNGVRTYSGLFYGGVETCGVVACLNESVISCGERFQNYSNVVWPMTFDTISIRGNFTQSDLHVQFPTTLLSSIRPLPVQEYVWAREEQGRTVVRTLDLQSSQNRLLTFGIFGRDFERDWDPIRNNTGNFADKMKFSNLMCCFYSVYFILFVLVT